MFIEISLKVAFVDTVWFTTFLGQGACWLECSACANLNSFKLECALAEDSFRHFQLCSVYIRSSIFAYKRDENVK